MEEDGKKISRSTSHSRSRHILILISSTHYIIKHTIALTTHTFTQHICSSFCQICPIFTSITFYSKSCSLSC